MSGLRGHLKLSVHCIEIELGTHGHSSDCRVAVGYTGGYVLNERLVCVIL